VYQTINIVNNKKINLELNVWVAGDNANDDSSHQIQDIQLRNYISQSNTL